MHAPLASVFRRRARSAWRRRSGSARRRLRRCRTDFRHRRGGCAGARRQSALAARATCPRQHTCPWSGTCHGRRPRCARRRRCTAGWPADHRRRRPASVVAPRAAKTSLGRRRPRATSSTLVQQPLVVWPVRHLLLHRPLFSFLASLKSHLAASKLADGRSRHMIGGLAQDYWRLSWRVSRQRRHPLELSLSQHQRLPLGSFPPLPQPSPSPHPNRPLNLPRKMELDYVEPIPLQSGITLRERRRLFSVCKGTTKGNKEGYGTREGDGTRRGRSATSGSTCRPTIILMMIILVCMELLELRQGRRGGEFRSGPTCCLRRRRSRSPPR